ncbi:MAG: hypothetical protein Q8N75_05560 [Pseudomonadota bacterium]|nr:hypothetical protein [Pseudomonadota bacterium]
MISPSNAAEARPARAADLAPQFALQGFQALLAHPALPNLRRFQRIGRRYLDAPPQSAEALTQLAALPAGATVYLLSIRHHRQLSFDFARLWHEERDLGG